MMKKTWNLVAMKTQSYVICWQGFIKNVDILTWRDPASALEQALRHEMFEDINNKSG